jgi:hypothetical protein
VRKKTTRKKNVYVCGVVVDVENVDIINQGGITHTKEEEEEVTSSES